MGMRAMPTRKRGAMTEAKVHPITKARENKADIIERVLAVGDLKQLTPEERNEYYLACCRSLGLNPLTRPFEYIVLQGKTILYARRDCADQIRRLRGVSINSLDKQVVQDVYVVTVEASDMNGRKDQATGAVNIANLKGESLANAMMKAETKAKRRVTLSLCGLGLIDETEVEDIQRAERGKTLSKPKAKPVYEALETELRACADEPSLKAWMADVNTLDRISVLPEDWQDALRLEAKAALANMRIKAAGGEEAVKEIDEAAQSAAEERGAAFIAEFSEACDACATPEELTEVQNSLLTPLRGKVADRVIEAMDDIFAKHCERLQ